MTAQYASTLNAGLGMIEETRIMLNLWAPGMSTSDLHRAALSSGRFPKMSARRLRNFVVEGFAPTCLHDGEETTLVLRQAKEALSSREFEQLLFLQTCRAHTVFADFVRQVYWPTYAAGHTTISNEEAALFVQRANEDGRTTSPWSESTVKRVARYLTLYCADFGLLERGTRSVRKILPFRIEPNVATMLAYDLHFDGQGDNQIVNHPEWQLFGLEPLDVLSELKRLALKGHLIVQHAGGVTDIGWPYKSWEGVLDAITE